MSFFTDLTTARIAGLVLLAAGAVITFASAKISARMRAPRANLIVKLAGLGAVVAGFVLIMFL